MRVLLVEDHALFREGVSLMLKRLDENIDIHYAASASEARKQVETLSELSLILLDYHLPDGNDLALLDELLDALPNISIIMLSAEQDGRLIKDSLARGAKGFIPKSSSSEVMLSAVQLVLAGGIYIPPDALTSAEPSPNAPPTPQTQSTSSSSTLTERQLDVLRQMAGGLSNKEIARELNMSPSTVKVHVAAILREFNVKNRTQAVNHAKTKGVISL